MSGVGDRLEADAPLGSPMDQQTDAYSALVVITTGTDDEEEFGLLDHVP